MQRAPTDFQAIRARISPYISDQQIRAAIDERGTVGSNIITELMAAWRTQGLTDRGPTQQLPRCIPQYEPRPGPLPPPTQRGRLPDIGSDRAVYSAREPPR